MPTYKIVRHFQDDKHPKKVVRRGLTLEEAQEHCNDPESSWKTCTGSVGKEWTRNFGPWFDGYTEE